MPSLRVLSSASVVLLLSACATSQGGESMSIFSGIGAFGDVCKNKCVVTIAVSEPCTTAANIVVDPMELEMKGRKGTIAFRLPKGGDYAFCPANGDGVFLQPYQSGDQFVYAAPTDNDSGDEDSSPKDKCRKNYRVYNFNGDSAKDAKYYYFLRFTNTKSNASCSKDPWIRNN